MKKTTQAARIVVLEETLQHYQDSYRIASERLRQTEKSLQAKVAECEDHANNVMRAAERITLLEMLLRLSQGALQEKSTTVEAISTGLDPSRPSWYYPLGVKP
jgi:hypothetical protein